MNLQNEKIAALLNMISIPSIYLQHKINNISKKLSIFNNLTIHCAYFVPKVGYFATLVISLHLL